MSVRYKIEVLDKATGPMKKIDDQFEKTEDHYLSLTNASKRLRDEKGRFVAGSKGVVSGTNNIASSLMRLTPLLGATAAAMSVTALVNYSRHALTVAGSFEKLNAVLSNKLGSQYAGNTAMAMIKEFAKVTPYSVDELTASYNKLVSQGFQPTVEQMTALGDIAASMGKPFDQLAEAVLDAQTGEFERLKEFGIKASAEGDKVAMTFQGQTTVIDKGAAAMQRYLIQLGKMPGVMGSMAVISKTQEGLESNLEDAWTNLAAAVGERLQPAYKDLLGTGIQVAEWLTDLVEIPIEEKLQGQIDKVMALSAEMFSSNTSHQRQLELLEQLRQINPKIVDGIDKQNISYEKLRQNIDNVVGSMRTKIFLERFNADNAETLTTYSEAKNTADASFQEAMAVVAKVSPELAMRTDLSLGQKQLEAQRILRDRIKANSKNLPVSMGASSFGVTQSRAATEDEQLLGSLRGTIQRNNEARATMQQLQPEMNTITATRDALTKQIDEFMPSNPNAVSTAPGAAAGGTAGRTGGGGGSAAGGKAAVSNTISSIASGGVRPTQIVINIGKAIETQVINTNGGPRDAGRQAGDNIVEEVLKAINGANAALATE